MESRLGTDRTPRPVDPQEVCRDGIGAGSRCRFREGRGRAGQEVPRRHDSRERVKEDGDEVEDDAKAPHRSAATKKKAFDKKKKKKKKNQDGDGA